MLFRDSLCAPWEFLRISPWVGRGDDLAASFANPKTSTITRYHPCPGWMEPSSHLEQISESSLPTNNGTNRYHHVRYCGSPDNLFIVVYFSSTFPQQHHEGPPFFTTNHLPPTLHTITTTRNQNASPPPARSPPARPQPRNHHHHNQHNPSSASPNSHRAGPLPPAQVSQRAHLQRRGPDVDQRHAGRRRVALLLGAVDFCAGEFEDLVSCYLSCTYRCYCWLCDVVTLGVLEI